MWPNLLNDLEMFEAPNVSGLKYVKTHFLCAKGGQKNINPLLHWCFAIRADIALATARAISPRIANYQCNNGLISVFLVSRQLHEHGDGTR